LSSKHRGMKKSFETQVRVNSRVIPLNHFVQETMANVVMGFLKTLHEAEEAPRSIDVRITRLEKQVEVDAHTYP
jgi:hypothetical protein